jgi:hypothetical protein
MFFAELSLKLRAARRLGAFKRARRRGMSIEQARAYSDDVYPPTSDDIDFERRWRAKEQNGHLRNAKLPLPWGSGIALLYPIAASFYVAQHTPASVMTVVGYGFANLAYLMFAAGVIAGHFYIFNLRTRLHVFIAAIVLFGAGTLLSNMGFP